MHEADQLTAVVQETTFRNEDNGYTVLRVGTGRAQQTVVGVMPELSPGENVTFEGYWTEHPVYGRQFSASSCAITPPTGKSAIEKYLGSGLIRGIGPATAKLIVARFGERALDILDEQPQRLTELPGIGPKKAAMIAESYLQQMGMRRALVFLQNYGISPTLAMRIAKYYGEDTVELVRENPYRMVLDVEGVGFLTADRMALSMGIDPQSDFRIRAALFYLMGEAAVNGGHTYLPREMLLERACKMLRAEAELVDRQIAQGLLQKMLMGFSLPDCEQALCLPLYFHAEQEIALRLAQLMRARPYKRVAGLDKRILQYEGELGVHFSALQKRAITSAVEEGVLVVTGGPGTGKTTIIRCIISLLKAENDILLCAPTGRAAKRMSEACGMEAKTLHRLLEYGGEEGDFARTQDNPLEFDTLIIDELSMVDIFLMRSLLRALVPGTRLIMVGDADQLPSVGAGNVLRDILDSEVIPSVRLTEIFRQAAASAIIRGARAVDQGACPVLKNEAAGDFFFLRRLDPAAAVETIVSLCQTRLPHNMGIPPEQIQVLSPTRKGSVGTTNLNRALQAAVNPPAPEKREKAFGTTIFREGDRVMQVKNNYDVLWEETDGSGVGMGIFNGDSGHIEQIDKDSNLVPGDFEGRRAGYSPDMMTQLEPAYAVTVHKSQGSEYRAVILAALDAAPMLLTRGGLYTAMTRARTLLIVVGDDQVLARMAANDRQQRRYSGLRARLARTAEPAEPAPEQLQL